MAKLDKILEAMDSFRIDSDVALLENEGLDDLTRAQTKKILHESFGFIKTQLIQGGILEDTQAMLAGHWTQAIMEDIDLEHIAGGAQGLGHGIAATAGGLIGAAQGGNLGNVDYQKIPGMIGNVTQGGFENGYNQDANVGDTFGAAKFAGENPGLTAAGLVGGGGLAAAGTMKAMDVAPKVVGGVKNQVGAAAAGATGAAGPVKPGTQTAYNVGATLGKVKRAFSK